VTPPDEGDASLTAPDEPARTDDGDRVAFDPAGRPPPGELARTAQRFLLVVAIAIGLVVLWLLRDLLIVLLLALLVASGMYGIVAPLERRVPRIAAIGIAYLALLLALTGVGLLVAPPLVAEAANLVEDLPALFEELQAEVSRVIDGVAGSGSGQQLFDRFLPQVVEDQADEQLFALPFTVLQVLTNLAVLLFLSAVILLERDAILRWAGRFLVARDRRPALNLVHTASTKLGGYVRGQLLVMLVTGVGTAVGMMLLGVPFALPMGLLGFLAEAIPLAGPIIAGVPVLVLAFLESPTTGLLMLAWLVVLQQLEGWLIYPIIQGRILALSPLVVIVAVLAGATLYGVLGAIIAVPIVAIVDVVLREIVFPLRRQASRRDARAARRAEAEAG
jgi:predicted PurR-regulated permease PerM